MGRPIAAHPLAMTSELSNAAPAPDGRASKPGPPSSVDGPEPPSAVRWMRYWWIPLALLLLLEALPLLLGRAIGGRIPYSAFLTHLDEGRVLAVTIDTHEIAGTMVRPSGRSRTAPPDTVAFATTRVDDPALLEALRRHRVIIEGVATGGLGRTLAAWIVPLLLLWALWHYVWRPAALASSHGVLGMGESRARVYVERTTKVTFDDVAGVDEAKAELSEIVAFLRDPAAFSRLGARMPRGILLVGEPGTGKTLLARAVAGESRVPFFFINGSEFVELFVGIGAARVRSLFTQARQSAPCILFIDEIDALGKSRGASLVSGANDEKEQTLNQLLAELDGFDPTSGVVLLAATNRPDTLDPALLRAGRFDRRILVDRPDRTGRTQILTVHTRRIRTDPTLTLDSVAGMTPGFTGADLANLTNEAALVATRRGAPSVTLDDFTAAIERIVAGPSRAHRLMSAADRERTACHEMGHALVALAVPGSHPIQKVSIIPRALGALGFTLQRPTEDRYLASHGELDGQLTVLMGGRAAEMLVLGDLSTGAADDLAKATELANQMVARFGMDPRVGHAVHVDPDAIRGFGVAVRTADHRLGSDETQREIDLAVREQLQRALDRAAGLLREHRAALDAGRQLLLERETLGGDEVMTLWRTSPTSATPPSIPVTPSRRTGAGLPPSQQRLQVGEQR